MNVKQLITQLLEHDMDEMVVLTISNEDNTKIVWYPDVVIGTLKQSDGLTFCDISWESCSEVYPKK